MTVRQWLDEAFDEVIVADGLEEAFIGVASACGRPDTAIYDEEKVIGILMERDGMSEDEAVEWFDFNISGAYVEGGPLFLVRPPED